MGMAYPRHSKLEALRKRRGWKRSVLAQRVGISYQHIYGIERGFNGVTEETLQLIANELGVELGEIQESAHGRPDDASDAAPANTTAEADETADEVSAA